MGRERWSRTCENRDREVGWRAVLLYAAWLTGSREHRLGIPEEAGQDIPPREALLFSPAPPPVLHLQRIVNPWKK